jgi:hypothetical protein
MSCPSTSSFGSCARILASPQKSLEQPIQRLSNSGPRPLAPPRHHLFVRRWDCATVERAISDVIGYAEGEDWSGLRDWRRPAPRRARARRRRREQRRCGLRGDRGRRRERVTHRASSCRSARSWTACSRSRALVRWALASPASSSIMRSGFSRSAGCDGSRKHDCVTAADLTAF